MMMFVYTKEWVKMRQIVSKLILIMLCVAGLTGFIYIDNQDEMVNSEMELSFYLGEEVLYAWEDQGVYYLFLPSYAECGELELTPYSAEFQIADENIVLENGKSLPNLPLNEMFTCKCTATGESFSLCVMRSENLPALFMQTDSGSVEAIWADKEVEENGKMQLFSTNGELLFTGGLNSIKSRGNYSFEHYAKKPFSITTKEEVSLLGLGSGQKYILLSNASDPTLIRNDIARRMETALDTEYVNVGKFLDLYVNGEYLGNYYLCENIEIGYDRIDITDLEGQMDLLYQNSNYESLEQFETETKRASYMEKNPDDITGGYLVEREFENRYELEASANPSGFITAGEEHFIVQSPMYCSVEQINYLENYFNETEAAIVAEDGVNPTTQKSYEEYIDVDSFVKKYLVEEVTKNYDAGVSSVFFYKDSDEVDGRLKAAPVWDCDMSFGNYLDWMEYFSEDPKGVSRLSLHVHASPWYDALYQKEAYYQKVKQYYIDCVSPYLEQLITENIDEYKETLQASAAMNEIRWREDFEQNPNYRNRDDSFRKLKQFIFARKEFLDLEWVDEVPYCIVTFEKEEVIYAIRYIEAGKTLTDLPVVEEDGFTGWNYTGEAITKDTVITCKQANK